MDHIVRAHKQYSCKTASCCSNPLPNQHLVLQCSQEEHATCESIRERIISWLKTKAQIGAFQIVAFACLPFFSYKDTCLTYTNITYCIYSWLSTFNTSCVSIFIAKALFHAETKSAVKHFAWQFAELLTVVLLLFFRFLGGMASFPQKSLPGCKQRRVKVMCSCKYGKEVKKEQVTDCPQQAKNHFSVCICMYIYIGLIRIAKCRLQICSESNSRQQLDGRLFTTGETPCLFASHRVVDRGWLLPG